MFRRRWLLVPWGQRDKPRWQSQASSWQGSCRLGDVRGVLISLQLPLLVPAAVQCRLDFVNAGLQWVIRELAMLADSAMLLLQVGRTLRIIQRNMSHDLIQST